MKKIQQFFAFIYEKYRHRHDYSNYRIYHRPLLAILIFILIAVVSFYAGGGRSGLWAFLFPARDRLPEKITFEKGGKVGVKTGRLLVKFSDSVANSEKDKIIKKHGLVNILDIKGVDVKIVAVPGGDKTEEILDRLMREENEKIEFAETDDVFAPDFIPNDPWFINWQKDKQVINAPGAWDVVTGSSILIVAVADTGVDCTHEDLAANCISGWNFFGNNSDTHDVYGHGTKVAGVIAAAGNNSVGVAGAVWQSKIMPVRVSDINGYASISSIANAIIYAADHGAKVVNVSYAVSGSRTIRRAGKYMMGKGGLVTVSAGNGGALDGNSKASELVVVSATDADDNIYSWSNFGWDVDVSAPGCTGAATQIGGGYGSFCGTSNSAPETAGVLMLIWSVNSAFTPDIAENILISTVKDLGPAGWDSAYGWGRIDAASAVSKAIVTEPVANTSNSTSGPKKK